MENRQISDIAYRKFLNEDKLMGSRCKSCSAIYLPPRPICIKCNSSDIEWAKMNGKGKLVAFTAINIGPPFMMEEGFDRNNPYCVGVIELDEGVRIDARLEGVDAKNPETIKVGTPLTVKFLHRGEGENKKTFLIFKT